MANWTPAQQQQAQMWQRKWDMAGNPQDDQPGNDPQQKQLEMFKHLFPNIFAPQQPQRQPRQHIPFNPPNAFNSDFFGNQLQGAMGQIGQANVNNQIASQGTQDRNLGLREAQVPENVELIRAMTKLAMLRPLLAMLTGQFGNIGQSGLGMGRGLQGFRSSDSPVSITLPQQGGGFGGGFRSPFSGWY